MEGLSSVQIQLSSPLPPTGVSDINLQEYLQTSFCEILTDNNNNKKNHGKYYWRGFIWIVTSLNLKLTRHSHEDGYQNA